MNELKDPENEKKDKGNLQLIHHGVNTKNYNQGLGDLIKLNGAI